MTISPEQLCDHMAVAVTGLDLNRPADTATQAALRDALNRNLVLCIRDQRLAPRGVSRRHGAVRHTDAAQAAGAHRANAPRSTSSRARIATCWATARSS